MSVTVFMFGTAELNGELTHLVLMTNFSIANCSLLALLLSISFSSVTCYTICYSISTYHCKDWPHYFISEFYINIILYFRISKSSVLLSEIEHLLYLTLSAHLQMNASAVTYFTFSVERGSKTRKGKGEAEWTLTMWQMAVVLFQLWEVKVSSGSERANGYAVELRWAARK